MTAEPLPPSALAAILGGEVHADLRVLHLAAAGAREARHDVLGEVLHLRLDLVALEAAALEPSVEHEVFVAALLLYLEDLLADLVGRAEERDTLLDQERGVDLLVDRVHRLVGFREHGGEAERAVVVPLQLER